MHPNWRKIDWSFVILLAGFSAFVVLSNQFDWDHFFSAFYVDRQSWIFDHRLPLWSYSLCAGSTRVGDPQSFGLSPTFIPVLIFGAFWGAKLLVISSAALGWYYLKKIGELIWRLCSPSPLHERSRLFISLLASGFIFSNYFLWHFHEGHVTFALFFSVVAILYYVFRFVFETFRLRDAFALGFLIFCYESSGLYHSFIFFVIPLTIAVLALLIAAFVNGLLKNRRCELTRFLECTALGITCGLFKPLAVAIYQVSHPRVIPLNNGDEVFSWLDAFVVQFFPSWHNHFAGIHYHLGPFGIWEYSAFNILGWVVIFLFVSLGAKRFLISFRPGANRKLQTLFVFLASILALALSTSLSSNNIFSLHYYLFNLTNGSIRVVGRYQILWVLFFFLTAVVLIAKNSAWFAPKLSRSRILLTAVLLLNFFTFAPALDPSHLAQALADEKIDRSSGPEQRLDVIEKRVLQGSFMYPSLRRGEIVPNCYQPLARDEAFMTEQGNPKESKTKPEGSPKELSLIATDSGVKISDVCRAQTFVTENDLSIGVNCPAKMCLNLNDINPDEPVDSRLAYDPSQHLWCLH